MWSITRPSRPITDDEALFVDTLRGRYNGDFSRLDVATRITPEKTTFPAFTDTNKYRELGEYWAPYIAQETWWQPKADIPMRFDYDGHWNRDNNWENLDAGLSQAYVHYAAVETKSHWFLHYNFFHPRDYSDNWTKGARGVWGGGADGDLGPQQCTHTRTITGCAKRRTTLTRRSISTTGAARWFSWRRGAWRVGGWCEEFDFFGVEKGFHFGYGRHTFLYRHGRSRQTWQ